MTQPTDLADKGREIEEWIDLRFFRPAGLALVRAVEPTRITPDQVTLASLAMGLVAGHLFWYQSAAVNAVGLALFIVSDILDSADGQLARRRGTSTHFGRMLDGVADNLRFLNLYGFLLARLLVAGGGWPVLLLGGAAGLAHSWQSAAADFIRLAYQWAVDGRTPDLPDTAAALSRPPRLIERLYAGYVRRQARLFPTTVRLIRRGGAPPNSAFAGRYREQLGPTMRRCAWIGQNIRWALLLSVVAGWPSGFLWLTAVPLTVVLAMLVRAQEREARALLESIDAAREDHVRVA